MKSTADHLFIPLARETVDAIERDTDPLARIRHVRSMRQWVEDVLEEFIADARGAGEGWDDIAAALEVSRQAAWQRYRKVDDYGKVAAAMSAHGFLRSGEIWSIMTTRMRRDRWYDLQTIYGLVSEKAQLTERDLEPDAPGSNSPRWQRNVRNVLQRRKTAGDLDWDGGGRYRLG